MLTFKYKQKTTQKKQQQTDSNNEKNTYTVNFSYLRYLLVLCVRTLGFSK